MPALRRGFHNDTSQIGLELTDLFPGLFDPAVQHRSVQANSEVLTSMLRDVLDFSKIEARQTTTVEEPFSLLEVTESVADALSVHAEAKGLDLVCYCDPRIPRALKGDADHLRQVLINLIGNAIKFTDQGEILLETTLQHSTPEESKIQIVVEDTGVGIPKAQQRMSLSSLCKPTSPPVVNLEGQGSASASRSLSLS